MRIREIFPLEGAVLRVVTEDGRVGTVDISCYLDAPAFEALKSKDEFSRVRNGKYFIEWDCGADLSADTLESRMQWEGSKEQLMVAEDPTEYKSK
jgi:hypothetical protein